MRNYHSKSSFRLFPLVAVAALLISLGGNSSAAVSGGDDKGTGSASSQTVVAGDGFVIDGYQSIKFGMNVIELKNMGYRCPNYRRTICQLDDGMTTTETLLGKVANPRVWVVDNEVRRIDVSVDIKPENMLNHFKESFGEPEVYRYSSLTNHLMEAYYWVSLDGSSVSLIRDFGKIKTATGDDVDKASSKIKYQNTERTLKSIKDIKQRAIPTEKVIISHR